MKKIPVLDEKDLDALIAEALKGNGVLATPKEISQMLINLQGVSINSKPRKDGRFQGYIVDGTQKKYVYGKTREETAFKIRELLKNGLPQKKEETTSKIPDTFNEFAKYYFENFRIKKVSKQTYYNDIKRSEKYLFPVFADKSIKKITPIECQKILDDIKSTGKGKTGDEIYSLMSVIFKAAIKHGIIQTNPLDIVFHTVHERQHGSALTKEEEARLFSAPMGDKYRLIFAIMAYAGLRPNELKTVKIDVNMLVSVNSKRKNQKVEYKRIPISPMLAPFIKELPKIPCAKQIQTVLKSVLPNHKPYDLRTTFYSRCKECGISEYAIKEYMGHSLGALGNAYTDLSDTFLIKEMQKFTYELPSV